MVCTCSEEKYKCLSGKVWAIETEWHQDRQRQIEELLKDLIIHNMVHLDLTEYTILDRRQFWIKIKGQLLIEHPFAPGQAWQSYFDIPYFQWY